MLSHSKRIYHNCLRQILRMGIANMTINNVSIVLIFPMANNVFGYDNIQANFLHLHHPVFPLDIFIDNWISCMHMVRNRIKRCSSISLIATSSIIKRLCFSSQCHISKHSNFALFFWIVTQRQRNCLYSFHNGNDDIFKFSDTYNFSKDEMRKEVTLLQLNLSDNLWNTKQSCYLQGL